MWKATREIFNYLPDAGFAHIRARVENYQSNLQVIIESVGPATDGAYNPADLLPTTTKNIDQMFAKLSEVLRTVRNKHLLAIVNAYLRGRAADGTLQSDRQRLKASITPGSAGCWSTRSTPSKSVTPSAGFYPNLQSRPGHRRPVPARHRQRRGNCDTRRRSATATAGNSLGTLSRAPCGLEHKAAQEPSRLAARRAHSPADY